MRALARLYKLLVYRIKLSVQRAIWFLIEAPPKKITHAHIYVHKHMIIITSTVIIVTVII